MPILKLPKLKPRKPGDPVPEAGVFARRIREAGEKDPQFWDKFFAEVMRKVIPKVEAYERARRRSRERLGRRYFC